MKLNILIISQEQYGYLIDYYKYTQYLKNDFEITFYCWDYGRPKVENNGIALVYVSRSGSILSRNIRFIIQIFKLCRKQKYDLCFISYFRGCSIVRLFAKSTPKILDLRTSYVHLSRIYRVVNNYLIVLESLTFKKITIISNGLANYLHISKSKFVELSLGADTMSVSPKIYNKINLLYVGTLYDRNIEDTIIGFKKFLDNNNDTNSTYTIIGTGWKNEEAELRSLILSLGLENQVFVLGYIKYELLYQYYEKATIGVSYIPITPYYQFQPPTKTFEYLQAGLPVIATNTVENARVITSENGCLIEDSPHSFIQGLQNIVDSFQSFDMKTIQESAKYHTWSYICNNLKNIIIEDIRENIIHSKR
jgi:glycosyltransferase involved in cell wall biosynthesis